MVKGGLDVGTSLGHGALGAVTDAVSSAGHLVGGPLGHIISDVAHTADTLGSGLTSGISHAVGAGVSGVLNAAGDLSQSIGHQAGAISHDLGALASDLSHGNAHAALNDLFKLAGDVLGSHDGGHSGGHESGHGGFWDQIAQAIHHAGDNAHGGNANSGVFHLPLHGDGSSHHPIIADGFGDHGIGDHGHGDHGHAGNTGIVPPHFDIGHAGGAHDAPHHDFSHVAHMDDSHHFTLHG